MKIILFTISILTILACEPEHKNPCEIDKFNNTSFIGPIRLCDSISGQFMETGGKADLTLLDSIFTIHLISTDTTVSINQLIQATSECYVFEGDVYHRLFDLDSMTELGSIYLDGNRLFLDTKNNSCDEDFYFIGDMQR